MKKSLFLTLIFCAVSLIAQEKADRFTSGSNNQTRNPRMDYMSYVPNEILVKFKDETSISTASKIKAAGISGVDQVLQKYEITSLERLFPGEKKPTRSKVMRAPNGAELKVPALDKIYRVTVPNTETPLAHPVNIHQIIEELKALPEIEYAEPNYIYTIGQTQPIGPELTADDLARMQQNREKTVGNAVVPNDPLYPQQWYIPAVKADLVWEQTTGDTTQVIAILDTGVDWTHPDLKNKIWRNPGEIPGNGIDDDGNGFIDDYMGWDFINNDNNPMDDNSHGTHVAGIAAAEANNGIGIAGVNWHAKIMPLKVLQSSGRGDAATITKGIIYAAQKGATVINMSFGSYARSMTMEDALLNAYATTILVAAAGNDDLCLGPGARCAPFFPAAISIVLGVQSPESTFSNNDQDGPTFSNYIDFLNYELKAPGTNIISTIPNGNYRVYQGTSMAAPIISGAVSLYRKVITEADETQENMWVKLIQCTDYYLNIFESIIKTPRPEVRLYKINIDDSGGDNDGKIDAGEYLQIWFNLRNTGKQVNSTKLELRLKEFEDTSNVEFIKRIAYIGSMSPYATQNNRTDPIEIRIGSNVGHDRDINFELIIWPEGADEPNIHTFTCKIENGVHLSGILTNDFTLTNDKFWIINQSLRISAGVTLTIQPGTRIEINSNIDNRGYVSSIGEKNNLIYIKNGHFGGNNKYEYTSFDLTSKSVVVKSPNIIKNCVFFDNNISAGSLGTWQGVQAPSAYNCFFNGLFSNTDTPGSGLRFNKISESYFKNIYTWVGFMLSDSINNSVMENMINVTGGSYYDWAYIRSLSNFNQTSRIQNSVFSGIKASEKIIRPSILLLINASEANNYSNKNNSFLGNDENFHFFGTKGSEDFISMPNIYWGTTDSLKIKHKYYDFRFNSTIPYLFFNPIQSIPSILCHAHVWKVLLNGKDAQDDHIDPIGVGKQRFDVYFNRPMDKAIIPHVSFGVRYPYNQQAVNEDGSWSEDGKIYTVYKTIKLTTGDGINRIRVAGAKEIDGWDFEIPVEDLRFEFIIAAATSASIDFMATPGLGKVELEWNDNDLEDGLGYNMYRMEHINDSTLTQPVIVNSSLITDTLFTDYSVVPNRRYYYYYKILRTNMAETDSSRVVSAVPFTASKGDANGDLSVNVLDITTIVAYLLNNNPQPFIFEAADVNSDGQINVLDIVGVVNLVLDVPQNALGIAMNKQVDLYVQNDTLFANSNVNIGAIQFDLAGIAQFSELEVLDALKTFESGNSYANGSLRVIFYSMSGKSIEPGQAIPLLKLKSGSMINDAIIGEPNGSSVKVNYIQTRIPDISANMNQTIAELGQNYPNPANGYTTIPVRIYEPVDELVLRVTNMLGQEVEVIRLSNPVTGENLINWNPKHHKGLMMYKLEIRQGANRSVCPAKRMLVR